MTTQDEAKQAAQKELDAATVQDLDGAAALWATHREALGGKSSVTGAALPDWEGCNVVAKAAHLAMFRTARSMEWDAFAHRWTTKGPVTGPAINWTRSTGA